MKRHKWSLYDRTSQLYRHQKCVNCDLHKAVTRSTWHHTSETYYFEVDIKGVISRYGEMTRRVPYECGSQVPDLTVNDLGDDLFEI